jgi:penicillin amidase
MACSASRRLWLWWFVSGCIVMGIAAEGAAGETLHVPGLRAPIEVLVDRWGVDHIYADNEHDLFFAQGYRAASNRLFQFELWRRQATGTVAEILGPRAVDRDRGARLLRFRGNLAQELNHYHPRGEQIVAAFVAGVNAWIEHTERHPELLPIEFRVLDIKPGRWTPEVVISRHQGLTYNVGEELDLGRAVAQLGADAVRQLVWLHPGEPDLTLDPAIDPEVLSADLLRLYRATRSPVPFRPDDVLPEFRAQAAPGDTTALDPLDRRAGFDWRDLGSNNWVVSGRRTESGAALLANDPHRVLQAPSLRYFVHLVAPGWNVIGGGEPTLPGVSIGHNEYGAWGLTIYRIDSEDLLVYETDPENPGRYRYRDGWEPMTIQRESINVRGQPPVEAELKFTRHGPVLYEDAQRRVAVALRAGWLEIGAAPYLASLRIDGARNWEQFREACSYSRLPGLNMVWAGADGQIGWQVVGIAPLRRHHSGLVPVPGDGRFEWDGYLPIRQLPHVVDPDQGFWNTSNEAIVPSGYSHREALGWTWADPYRGARVAEVLAPASSSPCST